MVNPQGKPQPWGLKDAGGLQAFPLHLGLAPSSARAPVRGLLPALASGKQLARIQPTFIVPPLCCNMSSPRKEQQAARELEGERCLGRTRNSHRQSSQWPARSLMLPDRSPELAAYASGKKLKPSTHPRAVQVSAPPKHTGAAWGIVPVHRALCSATWCAPGCVTPRSRPWKGETPECQVVLLLLLGCHAPPRDEHHALPMPRFSASSRKYRLHPL